MYLVDTNVFIRTFTPDDKNYSTACEALKALHEQRYEIVLVPQVASEFWNVCTRPVERNGLGQDCEETERRLVEIEQNCSLYPDKPEIYTVWRRIVRDNDVRGVKVHDAKLVAAMNVHGISHILTFNVTDFQRYGCVTTVHPQDV